MMNVLKGSPKLSTNSGPITKNISDKKFIPRIKPLFYVFEEDIKKYAKARKLPFVEGKCPYREDSYRVQVMRFLNTLSKKDKQNIIRNFEQFQNKMAKTKDYKMQYCEICGEPSRKNICKKCELMRI